MVQKHDIISQFASRVPSSGTLRIATLTKELEAKGKKIIKLGIGEPNFTTPREVIEAAYKAMLEGKTGYTSSKGITPLLEKIAIIHSRETKVEINSKENVLVTPGAKASLFAGIISLLNPDENMIVISPYWPSYEGIASFIGAKTKIVQANYNDFSFPFEGIKEAIDNNTRILVINSPNNPTGAIYDKDTLKFVKDISDDHNLYIISDEIYRKIIFDGTYHQYLGIAQTLERTLIIDGLSKSHAMTGWRMGYSLGNKELISAMTKIQENASTCVNAPTQYASLVAFDLEEPTQMMVAAYKERRDKAFELINQSDYLSCKKPQGAFYLFIKFKGNISSEELIMKLLEEKGVAVTPGSAFGVQENYFRLSLASELADILEGISRINDLLSTVQ